MMIPRYAVMAALLVPALIMWQGCASTPAKEAQQFARVYDRPYDEVWEAVEHFILNDLHCASRKANRKRGFIETEWVHRFDTEGLVRWQIRAHLTRQKQGVRVALEKRVQMRDDVSKQISRYKQESNEPGTSNSGWSRAYLDDEAVRGYYAGIEQRMGY